MLFSEDFYILPSFVPINAFEQFRNARKSVKKFANADIVKNSKDKGLPVMSFVHELQVYISAEKNLIYICALVVGLPTKGM